MQADEDLNTENANDNELEGIEAPAATSGDGTPVAGAGGGGTTPQRRRKLALLGALVVFLVGISSTAVWYTVTKRPLTELPAVGLVAKSLPPRYIYSITGTTTPEAVAVSPDGQFLYVAESGGDRVVRVYNNRGEVVATLAPPGTDVGKRMPMSVAVAPNGRVFVTDRLRRAVDMYDGAGQYIGAYRPEAVQDEPWLPMGVSFTDKGEVLIADHQDGKHKILVFRPDENLDTAFGAQGEQPGQFSFPYTAVVDGNGRIYVSDSNNARIEVFDRQGKFLSAVTSAEPKSGLGLPRGLALDRQGRLYVVDAGGHTVVVYETGDTPKYLFTFGELGTAGGEFRYPSGVALDGNGRIYIADRDNNSIQVWAY